MAKKAKPRRYLHQNLMSRTIQFVLVDGRAGKATSKHKSVAEAVAFAGKNGFRLMPTRTLKEYKESL